MMLWYVLAFVLMLALSAFFSGTETAYATANHLRMKRAAETGGRVGRVAYANLLQYDRALTTILIGNNLVNNAATSLATIVVLAVLGDRFSWVATLVTTVLVLIFGEITPKLAAKANAEPFARGVALPLRALMWVTFPLVWLIGKFIGLLSRIWPAQEAAPAVTEDELEVLLDTAEDEGTIDENTTELLYSAMDFDDTRAREIITPRVDMEAIDIQDGIDQIREEAIASTYSRIPVYEDSKDNILGVLHVSRFLKHLLDDPDPDVRKLLLPACYVPETALLPDVLATMREKHCHLVIVCDEFGGTVGILTMEDVLEELVGDIWDETDEIDAALTPLSGGRYRALGSMRVDDLIDELDLDERDYPCESTTLGGWATERLGHTPRPGECFTEKALTLCVETVERHRVRTLTVSVHAAGEVLRQAAEG